MNISQPSTTSAPVKASRGRPYAHRPARICTRISTAAAAHLAAYRQQHRLSLAAALERVILQVPVDFNKNPHTINAPP